MSQPPLLIPDASLLGSGQLITGKKRKRPSTTPTPTPTPTTTGTNAGQGHTLSSNDTIPAPDAQGPGFRARPADKAFKAGGPNSDAFKRMSFLYQAAHLAEGMGQHDLSRFYVGTMKRVSTRKVIRISPELKRHMCKQCFSLLTVPGLGKQRLSSNRNAHIVTTCGHCGDQVRCNPNPRAKKDRARGPRTRKRWRIRDAESKGKGNEEATTTTTTTTTTKGEGMAVVGAKQGKAIGKKGDPATHGTRRRTKHKRAKQQRMAVGTGT